MWLSSNCELVLVVACLQLMWIGPSSLLDWWLNAKIQFLQQISGHPKVCKVWVNKGLSLECKAFRRVYKSHNGAVYALDIRIIWLFEEMAELSPREAKGWVHNLSVQRVWVFVHLEGMFFIF